jgi:hypothetical protein
MICSLIIYFAILLAFTFGLVLGLSFLFFAKRIFEWQIREFSDTREWVMQSRIYKFCPIKITSRKFYILSYRIIGAGFAIGCGAGVIQLLIWLFFPPK